MIKNSLPYTFLFSKFVNVSFEGKNEGVEGKKMKEWREG